MTHIIERQGLALPRLSTLSLLAAAAELLLTWQERARQRRTLQALDGRALADIGLGRADVAAECAKPFWTL